MGIIRKRRWSEYWAGLWRWAFVSGLSYDVIWAYCINSIRPLRAPPYTSTPFIFITTTYFNALVFFFHSNCVSDFFALWWWLILAPQ